ncbi:MAG: hypothetical protein BGO41_08390 [Clostridiales bacterium 38-18]|nr:MAG: hypothetical protein BGO41_08390 [Clostridiales bacterium 38-18]
MSNYTLGVIGGMGPLATSVYYERIIEKTDATKDQDHLDMIVLSHATMQDRTQAILSGQYEGFLDQIGKDIALLEQIGVQHIAIPCNTSHYFMPQMKAMTKVHIIDMVEETAIEIKNRFGAGKRVGILATNGTIHAKTYENACLEEGLIFVKPEGALQESVMKTIYDIKADCFADVSNFETIVATMMGEYACDCVILACTELSLIPISESIRTVVIDAMDVLVERSITYSGKTVINR